MTQGRSGVFQIGDRVQLLDEELEGRVVAIAGTTITILSAEGFELELTASELIRLPEEATRAHRIGTASALQKDTDLPKPRPQTGSRNRKGQPPPVIVDLHAEKLFAKKAFPDTYEMLDRQLEEARRMLEFALRKRIQHLIFIHGVGSGVLKAELKTLFGRYPEITVNQADFRTYGQGALEVYIPQSAFF